MMPEERYALFALFAYCVFCYVVVAIKLNPFRSGYGLNRAAFVLWILSPVLLTARGVGQALIIAHRLFGRAKRRPKNGKE